MENKKTIINVNGLDIKTNSLYKIENKPDNSAPDGFIKEGSTKLPSEGISNSVPCRWDEEKKQYDTGFYENSKCYEGLNQDQKEAKVQQARKYISSVYENDKGSNILEPNNFDFWDTFSIDLFEGRVFNTANIKDLLDLYIATLSSELTPTEKVGDPAFTGSDYVIKDAEKSISIRSTRNKEYMDALVSFGVLMDTDKDKLITLLKHIDVIRPSLIPTDREIRDGFMLWLDKNKAENPAKFNEINKRSKKDEEYDKIKLKIQVLKLIGTNRISKVNNEYLYDGVVLGIDSRSIVHNLTTDEDLITIAEAIRMT